MKVLKKRGGESKAMCVCIYKIKYLTGTLHDYMAIQSWAWHAERLQWSLPSITVIAFTVFFFFLLAQFGDDTSVASCPTENSQLILPHEERHSTMEFPIYVLPRIYI